MMTIGEFEEALASRIGRPSGLRPFVCDGNPLTCQAFIVGTNPATILNDDFWSFWSAESGFMKDSWLRRYTATRSSQRTAKGGSKRPLSSTRQRMEWISSEAAPLRFLETNLYAKATCTAAELNAVSRQSEAFQWLLSVISPQVILVHGAEAKHVIEKLSPAARVIYSKHLSRVSHKHAVELAHQLREIAS
jgi:hypothetical protein